MQYNTITKSLLVTTSLISSAAFANNFAVDGRGNGMGGTGVVSATYLTAPFYNPALTAIYSRKDSMGMILPGIGLTVKNEDNLIDDFGALESAASDPTSIPNALNNLSGDELKLDAGLVASFAIPNPILSANFYGKAYTESYLAPNIPDIPNSPTVPQLEDALNNTEMDAVSVGVFEIGLAMGKYVNVLGNHMSFGVTPKLQWISTYYNPISLSGEISLGTIKENTSGDSAFNFDAGTLWFYGPIRVGLSGKNMIKRDISTKTVSGSKHNYQLTPVYTVGAGYVDDYLSFSVDYDLNENKKYESFDDNEQMVRVGMEFDMYGQMQIRAGYKKNMANEDDYNYTAGVGFSPLGMAHVDIAASFKTIDFSSFTGNLENMGIYANFLVNY